MSVNTKEIAKICGVSRGTVDRALNNKDRINPKTKEKILATAKELGYRPDLLARSLVKGRTMNIGVIVFDIRNHYFAQLVNSIEMEARNKGYFVNITLQEKNSDMEIQLINSLVDRRVDGIIICPVNKGKDFDELLQSLPIPVVVIGNYISDKIPFVGIDEKKAATEAVSLIISKGYEKIIFVCPPLSERETENIYTHEQRTYGFIDRIENETAIESIIISDWNYLDAIETSLQQSNKRTAIFCSGDIFALNVVKHLKGIGKKIPSDIGIMGFDNIDTLEYVTPTVATVYNSVNEVAKTAVDNLTDLMNGKDINNFVLIDHKIIDGESL